MGVVERVGAVAAVQRVGARTAVKPVVAILAVDRLGPRLCSDEVGATPGIELETIEVPDSDAVAEIGAYDAFDRDEVIAEGVAAETLDAVLEIESNKPRGRAVVGGIDSGSAAEQ